eukprot:gene20265-biopygen13089
MTPGTSGPHHLCAILYRMDLCSSAAAAVPGILLCVSGKCGVYEVIALPPGGGAIESRHPPLPEPVSSKRRRLRPRGGGAAAQRTARRGLAPPGGRCGRAGLRYLALAQECSGFGGGWQEFGGPYFPTRARFVSFCQTRTKSGGP